LVCRRNLRETRAIDAAIAKRLFVYVLVAGMCATAAIAVAILLFSEFDDTSARILLTTGALSFYSLLALPGAGLLDRGRARPLAVAVLVLAALGLVLFLAMIWFAWSDPPEAFWKLVVTATAFAGAAAQAAASTSRLSPADGRALRWVFAASVLCSTGFAAMASAAAWFQVEREGFYRALGAVAVVAVFLSLLQPVLRRAVRGGPAATHHLRLTLADGRELALEEAGRGFAEAAAHAIREAERGGVRVVRVVRLD